MTLLGDVRNLTEEVRALGAKAEINSSLTERHEEQISGKRGILTAIDTLADEFSGLKRALYAAAGSVVVGSVLFAISVTKLIG